MIPIEPIIQSIKLDTSDYKAELKGLSGEQRKFKEAEIAGLEAQNKKLDSHIKMIGQAGIAIGAMTVAGKLMWDGMEHNARRAQLSTNVLWTDVNKLRQGFGGLRSEMQALEVANKLAQGSYKLTGSQMETVAKAMRQLVREGHSWDDVTQKVTEAFVKLEVDGLKDFGIHVGDAKTEGEKFNAVLREMSGKADKLTDSTQNSGEKMVSLKSKFADAMDGISSGLGKVGEMFLPVVEALAASAKWIGEIASYIPSGFLGKVADVAGWINPVSQGRKAIGAAYDYFSEDRTPTKLQGRLRKHVQIPDALRYDPTANMSTRAPVDDPNIAGIIGDGVATLRMYMYLAGGAPAQFLADVAKKAKPGKAGKATMPGYTLGASENPIGSSDIFAGGGFEDISSSINASSFLTANRNNRLAGYQVTHDKAQSRLESMFGPIEQFDAYRAAFESLTGAVQSSFGAWIDGSMSAGEAFKRFISDSLKAGAVQLLGEAVKHGVFAIGSLAFGDIRGAAQHGTAAAKAVAGAAALGVLAKSLGSGSSGGAAGSAGTGAGGAPPVGTTSGGGGGGGNTVVVAFGQDYTMDSSRQQQLRAARALNAAKQAGSNGGVSFG